MPLAKTPELVAIFSLLCVGSINLDIDISQHGVPAVFSIVSTTPPSTVQEVAVAVVGPTEFCMTFRVPIGARLFKDLVG
jgi:hypothetical protein